MDIPIQKIKEAKSLILKNEQYKIVHYRKVYNEINPSNFHIGTKTDFVEIKENGISTLDLWNKLKENNELIYYHQSKSGSIYFINKEFDIFRLATHWGLISSCHWTLEGKGIFRYDMFEEGPLQIGKTNIKDLEIYIHKNSPKRRSFILNPKWEIKIKKLMPLLQTLTLLKNHKDFKDLPVEKKKLIGETYGLLFRTLNYKCDQRLNKILSLE